MLIPKHKINAALVFILAIGMGVGIPLLSRMESRDIYANAVNPEQTDETQKSGTQENTATTSDGPEVQSFECAASPPAVYVGDQVIWSVKNENGSSSEQPQYIWSGAVTGTGPVVRSSYLIPGNYSVTVRSSSPDLGKSEAGCSVNVVEKPEAPSSSGPAPVSTNPALPAGNPSTESEKGAAQEIVSCKIINPTITINLNTISVVSCKLKPPGRVTARIIKGEYIPPAEPDAASVVKTLVAEKNIYDQSFSFNWNGIDSYDTPVPDGTYTFLVSARPSLEAKPDISIQKIQVLHSQPQQTQEQTAIVLASSQEQTPETVQQPSAEVVTAEQPKGPVESKCPGVNYPDDLQNSWSKEFITIAIDNCIFRGYSDGKFRPSREILRGEAVKASLIAAGISPKMGCYDTDCGTPFKDLTPAMAGWIRAAWDLKIIRGTTETLFVPQRSLTRGEAVMLIAKTFNIAPRKDCFSANCGAGQPNNFFMDIDDPELGSYLRVLWDMKVIQGSAQNSFEPDRPMVREEFATLLIKIALKLNKLSA